MSGKKVQQIEEDLRGKIEAGVLIHGTMLPGRQKLAQEYGVALSTLERAISSLVAEGLLRADNGRGTFVQSQPEPSQETLKAERTLTGATLGIAVARPEHYRDRILTEQVEQAFSECGGTAITLACAPGTQAEGLYEVARRLLSRGVDALVIIGYHAKHTALPGIALRLEAERSVPIAAVMSLPVEGSALAYVYYDNEDAGLQAAMHMMRCARGRGPIYGIAPFHCEWALCRESGMRRAAEASGDRNAVQFWPADRDALPHAGEVANQEAGYEAFRTLLAQKRIFDAPESLPCLIAVSDSVAHGVREAAEEVGAQVGVDFALMGIGDSERSQEMGLTSLRPPLEEMAREAVRLVRLPLLGKFIPLPERAVRLKMHLVRRTSTRLLDGVAPLR